MGRLCITCGAEPAEKWQQRCVLCRDARSLFMELASGRYLAGRAVYDAKVRGILPSARDFSCTDCGLPAIEYDHRDYNAPLLVEPVCRRCNLRRGHAIPKNWTFEQFRSWFSGFNGWARRDAETLGRLRQNHFPQA